MLPLGWEQVIDYSRGVYYINHVESKCRPSLGIEHPSVVDSDPHGSVLIWLSWIRIRIGNADPSSNPRIYQIPVFNILKIVKISKIMV